MINHMLVATDLNGQTSQLVSRAGALAERLGAEVTVLHVELPPALMLSAGERSVGLGPADVRRRAREAQRMRLEKIVREQIPPRLPSREALASDRRAHRGIVREAKRRGADLVVVGTEQRTWPKTWMLGPSTSVQVSHHAPCPVLLLPDDAGAVPAGGHILAATRPGDGVIDVAAELATHLEAKLTVLHVISLAERAPVDRLTRMLGGHAEHHERVRQKLVARIGANPAAAVDDVAVEVVSALSVSRAIRQRAEDPLVDLVVMGQRSRFALLERWVTSTTDRARRHIDKPVIVVPDSFHKATSSDATSEALVG